MSELRLKGEWVWAGRGDRMGKPCSQLESRGWAGELKDVWCPGSETEEGWAGQATFSSQPESNRETKGFSHMVTWLHLP